MYRDNKSGEYPLYRREVQERRPNVSLPDGEWAKQVLDFIDVSFVRPTSCPPYEPGTQTASIGATYIRTDVNTTGTTSGTATSANFNSTNYTFPGVSSGIAPTTTQTIYSSGATALALSWNIGTTNGSFSYSHPPFAINHTSQMTGSSTYNILGNVSAGGPYTGGIAAWRNNFAVSAGQTYNIQFLPVVRCG